jgi:hypothetical protein
VLSLKLELHLHIDCAVTFKPFDPHYPAGNPRKPKMGLKIYRRKNEGEMLS